jgi:hypothetical protein
MSAAVSRTEAHIDWNTAAMAENGMTLSVYVAFATTEWCAEFKKEVAQENLSFGSNGWGEIFLIGDRLLVRNVTRGSERRLRDTLDCLASSAQRAARREIASRDAAREELKLTLLTRAT